MISTPVTITVYRKEHDLTQEQRIINNAENFAAKYNLSFPSQTKVINQEGKPYFTRGDVKFSLSHSGDFWLCAFSSREVGLDLQVKKTCDYLGIAKRFFHPQEYEYITAWGKEGFFKIWTAKESYVKLTGQGIDQEFKHFSVLDHLGNFSAVSPQFTHLDLLDNYAICLCSQEPVSIMVQRCDL